MLTFDEMTSVIQTLLSDYCVNHPSITTPLSNIIGKVSSSDIHAEIPLPSCNTAAMDGYIFKSKFQLNTTYTVTTSIAAGDVLLETFEQEEVIRINTGAPVPDGYSYLIMQENVHVWTENQVSYLKLIKDDRQNHIRQAGEDVAQDSVIFSKGHQFQVQDLPLLAAVGLSQLPIMQPLKIGVISCGNELIEPGNTKNQYQAYDANRAPLLSMIQSLGHDSIDFGIIPDHQDTIRSTLLEMTKTCDLIITSGGASVGDYDFFANIVKDVGRVEKHKLAMKPGKPLMVGNIQSKPYIGLPGNPVSSFVCFRTLVAPALKKAFGQTPAASQFAKLTAPIRQSHNRLEFARALLKGDQVTPLPQQESHRVGGLSRANVLIKLQPGSIDMIPGELIEVLPIEC